MNHYALMTIYLLYNQHLTDDAKQLYNETLIRALKQEYEMINTEKNDSIEKYNELEAKYLNELNLNQQKMNQLQNKCDELLEHNELEHLDSKKLLNDLSEQYELRIRQYELNLYNLHQENETLKYNINVMLEQQQISPGTNYDQLKIEYEQLRKDYDEVINENELLKDYNSQMYQRKLKRNEENSGKIHY